MRGVRNALGADGGSMAPLFVRRRLQVDPELVAKGVPAGSQRRIGRFGNSFSKVSSLSQDFVDLNELAESIRANVRRGDLDQVMSDLNEMTRSVTAMVEFAMSVEGAPVVPASLVAETVFGLLQKVHEAVVRQSREAAGRNSNDAAILAMSVMGWPVDEELVERVRDQLAEGGPWRVLAATKLKAIGHPRFADDLARALLREREFEPAYSMLALFVEGTDRHPDDAAAHVLSLARDSMDRDAVSRLLAANAGRK